MIEKSFAIPFGRGFTTRDISSVAAVNVCNGLSSLKKLCNPFRAGVSQQGMDGMYRRVGLVENLVHCCTMSLCHPGSEMINKEIQI